MAPTSTLLDTTLEASEDGNNQQSKYLTFHLAGEDYGIEIRYVIEIVSLQKITKVVDMPDFIRGVINLRGKLIPVMDVRRRFGFEPRAYDDRTCIIVVHFNESPMGLLVDNVNEVTEIAENRIEPPPRANGALASRYIQGMGKIGQEVKILLDVSRLLGDDSLATQAF